MLRFKFAMFVAFALAAVSMFMLESGGTHLYMLSEGRSLASFLGVVFAVGALYELSVLIIGVAIRARKGAPSEVKMLASLLRALVVVMIGIVLLQSLGKLAGSWGIIAGFTGMLIGWSLQAPVSGLAAWAFVNIKRPFRIGDRVLLPAWGLTGDVRQIGMMYTVLNQVGGTVTSEERAGRDVLIPNAMLFGNVVINYTPQQEAAYVLDEVLVRITYNSNWDKAEQILTEAASEVTGDIIQQTGRRPYIRAEMYEYGVNMRLRYMTSATDRPRISYEITERIFNEFQKHPDVDFAIPYVFSQRTAMRAAARHLEAPPSPAQMQAEIEADQIHDPTGVASQPENAAQVKELAGKIAELGLLQPIVVERRQDGQFNVIAGHLRLAACKSLGWKTVPAIVKSPVGAEAPL